MSKWNRTVATNKRIHASGGLRVPLVEHKGRRVILTVTTRGFCIDDGAQQNPYRPPPATSDAPAADTRGFRRGEKKGPALYVASSGLVGTVLGSSLLGRHPLAALSLVFSGCIAGGVLYRARSRHWPVDPSARFRQARYIVALMTLIPGSLLLVSGLWDAPMTIVLIGAIAGFAISCGIIVSGARRHGTES